MPLARVPERILIETALKHTGGRKGEAAELLGWGRNTLTRKLKVLLPALADDWRPEAVPLARVPERILIETALKHTGGRSPQNRRGCRATRLGA